MKAVVIVVLALCVAFGAVAAKTGIKSIENHNAKVEKILGDI